MSRLTLDLNALGVESFSPQAAAGDPTQGTITSAYLCELNADTPMSLTNRVCCEAAGVEGGTQADTYITCVYAPAALTEAYPCKTTR